MMQVMMFRDWVRARLNVTEENERGANLVEYILLVAFIALIVVAAVRLLQVSITGKFTESQKCLDNAPAAC